MGEPRGMSAEDAAHHMGISAHTFRTHIAPEIRSINIGKRVIWLRDDLDAWLDRAAGKVSRIERASIPANPLDAVL